eukprot:CAMPEP_0181027636 /NCGR_PEP_ID=MMETSP1070-20121207/4264_1 /TAXON_ID=265543 /ORGANISM="Minutocellus polymorphus, Strain NH13" /LENGTH=141 /DNA_ID=CAMNT_0023104879 /DNA_START=37 /DNA_END=462 /DNA_ORIENTATION=-
MTKLATVFGIHRFVAGGFGLTLLLAPEAMNAAYRSDGDELPFGEKFALQSWGCFVIAVAGIVHAARRFPPDAQRAVGASLLTCFLLLDGLYAAVLLTNKDMDDKYREGCAITGAIFAALSALYAWGMVGTAHAGDGSRKRT